MNTKLIVQEIKRQYKDYIYITIGLFIAALGIHLFMAPNNFVTGGVSGLAIVIREAIPKNSVMIKYLPLGNIMLVLNVFLFIVGFIFIGFSFGVRTIYSSLALSIMVFIMGKLYPINEPLMEDLLIQLIYASVTSAIGLSIAFRFNASTGGTDITGKIINKFFHIDLGKAVLLSDLLITVSAFSINGFSSFIYGLLGVFLNGLLIDYFLSKFKERKEIVIISQKAEAIKTFIINEIEKGATIYEARGAFTNEEKEIIRTVVNRKEFIRLKIYIKEIDPHAFITVHAIHETFGEGFISITD